MELFSIIQRYNWSEAENGEANSNWSEAENGEAKAIHNIGIHFLPTRKAVFNNSKIQSSEAEEGEANSNWSEAENGEAKAIHNKGLSTNFWVREVNYRFAGTFTSKELDSALYSAFKNDKGLNIVRITIIDKHGTITRVNVEPYKKREQQNKKYFVALFGGAASFRQASP